MVVDYESNTLKTEIYEKAIIDVDVELFVSLINPPLYIPNQQNFGLSINNTVSGTILFYQFNNIDVLKETINQALLLHNENY